MISRALILASFVILFPLTAGAQTAAGVEYHSATALRDAVAAAARAPNRTAVHNGANRGGYSHVVVRRDQSGEAEVHDLLDDVFIVQEGTASLRYGGTVSGSRVTAPGERRGGEIAGGVTQRLAPGDMIIVPAGVPHRVEVESGGSVTYLVVKVARVPARAAP
ncbi:MAG: cupin domain-containing protein [Gemmatimonadetes bacterium]|nr:cupin domain-containing protein [Gemmatimonadota bacterium]